MTFLHQTVKWIAIAFGLCGCVLPAFCQDPPAPQSAAPPTLQGRISTPESRAVEAVLETRPATPIECVRAAWVLAELNRPDLAKEFLKKVIDASLDERRLVELNAQAGATTLLDLAGRSALPPEARQLADAVSAAKEKWQADAERIAGLIARLQDDSIDRRGEAMVALRDSGAAAVGPLLAVLADPTRDIEHENVRTVLSGMGRAARAPLLGILRGADAGMIVQAVETLALMNDPSVETALLEFAFSEQVDPAVRASAAGALRQAVGRAPSKAEAVRRLTDAAKNYFDHRVDLEGAIDGRVESWRWNPEKRQCEAEILLVEDASLEQAAHLARAAHRLAPDDRAIQVLYLATMLEAAAYRRGLDRPLEDQEAVVVEAKRFGAAVLEEVLAFGVSRNHAPAATAAARLLGQIGTAKALLHRGPKPAPLALAMRHPDRRLRLAALEAVVRLRPVEPYAGDSYVPAALEFFAASRGLRHALIVGANVEDADKLAGMVSAAGYRCQTAYNGQDALRLAAASPDVEFALIDTVIDRPAIDMLLQQLRHEERSAALRVGLLARAGRLDHAEKLARQDSLAMAFSRPLDAESLRWQLEQLAALKPREFVDFQSRQRQAALALDLWAELNRTSKALYDLRRIQNAALTALYNPNLAMKAAAVLADVNSPESQQALIDVASRFTQPAELRVAAARAFRRNTEQHGVLLTTGEIQTQYRRYNESAHLDATTQNILGLILDSIEAPTARGNDVQKAGFSAANP